MDNHHLFWHHPESDPSSEYHCNEHYGANTGRYAWNYYQTPTAELHQGHLSHVPEPVHQTYACVEPHQQQEQIPPTVSKKRWNHGKSTSISKVSPEERKLTREEKRRRRRASIKYRTAHATR